MNRAQLRAIVERAGRGTPVIDGDSATFLWRGSRPPALIGDLNDWDVATAPVLARAARGLWLHTVSLPPDAYVEYAYLLDGERVPDPLNPRVTPGGQPNHYFYMPGAGPTRLAQRRRGVAHGRVTRHVVDVSGLGLGQRRGVLLYRPPVDEPCSLLVVLDGRDYARWARLPDMVDNLLAEGRIRPVALAMVDNAGPGRMVEYACCETTVIWLRDYVLPLARTELPLLDGEALPGAHGICGASMGGLMALYTALRLPPLFGHVLAQSATLSLAGYEMVVHDLIRTRPPRPVRFWLDVGRFEELLPANQQLHALLAETGHDTVLRIYNAGHNYAAWRDDVWRGLEWLYGTAGAGDASRAAAIRSPLASGSNGVPSYPP